MANKPSLSFAVFPFLKTSGPVKIGPFTFRSTDDSSGLDPENVTRLREISEMLFVQDHYRIRSASYTTVPYLDLEFESSTLDDLADAQAVVAYFYSAPNPIFGDTFLSVEHASLIVFSPVLVTSGLVTSEYHADLMEESYLRGAEDLGAIPGYHGLYNFKHHFWAVKASRIFGPLPHMTLNISQDLHLHLDERRIDKSKYNMVSKLLLRPDSEVSRRVLTAIRWYNRGNTSSAPEEVSLVHLAVAFETLLALPEGERLTARFREAVNLLLGRLPRLDSWLMQFYKARSQILHEGRASNLRFSATDSKSVKGGAPVYHSLLSYGREVFQLCVGTIIVGAKLAEDARLAERLVTNQERFEELCRTLDDESKSCSERLRLIDDKISAIQRYRYVPESELKIEALLSAVKRAARCLLGCVLDLQPEIQQRLETLSKAERKRDHYEELEALMLVQDVITEDRLNLQSNDPKSVVYRLVDVVWDYTFMHFFWLKDQRAGEK